MIGNSRIMRGWTFGRIGSDLPDQASIYGGLSSARCVGVLNGAEEKTSG